MAKTGIRSGHRCLVPVLAALLVACGGGGGRDDSARETAGPTRAGTDESEPQRGGNVVYGLEAESSDGFCVGESQLSPSGIQVARSFYETLIVPNSDGEYVPFLAESVEPNDEGDVWTIKIRAGITFHDGSELTAEVVKNNLDSLRGAYPSRHSTLSVVSFMNVASVQVAGPLKVQVTMKTPWPSFPAALYGQGRPAMMAQAQLDDTETCATKPIGTGPFEIVEWKVNDHLTVRRNPSYWREGLPYLDEIEFRPITEGEQRVNSLQVGEIQVMHASAADQIVELRDLAESGDVALLENDRYAEVSYTMLNVKAAPFDHLAARRAFAFAIDRDKFNEIRNRGILKNATGPFPPGSMGYLADSGYPQHDLAEAKRLVQEYEKETGKPLEFTLSAGSGSAALKSAELLKEMAENAGMHVELKQTELTQLISDALAGNFAATAWRNHPGGDPDLQSVWWHSGGVLNFGKIADREVDRLLDAGMIETDLGKRTAIYEDLNRRMASQCYDLWGQWIRWAVATASDVHGVLGPDLPDGGAPFDGLVAAHSLAGLWVEG